MIDEIMNGNVAEVAQSFKEKMTSCFAPIPNEYSMDHNPTDENKSIENVQQRDDDLFPQKYRDAVKSTMGMICDGEGDTATIQTELTDTRLANITKCKKAVTSTLGMICDGEGDEATIQLKLTDSMNPEITSSYTYDEYTVTSKTVGLNTVEDNNKEENTISANGLISVYKQSSVKDVFAEKRNEQQFANTLQLDQPSKPEPEPEQSEAEMKRAELVDKMVQKRLGQRIPIDP